MKSRLANEYKAYQDKGTAVTKLGKLQSAMKVGLEQLRKPSHTVEELKIAVRKLYDIADYALRLSTEETLVQLLPKAISFPQKGVLSKIS